jgi:hypothetical protein
VIEEWSAIVLNDNGKRRWIAGQPLIGDVRRAESVRAYSVDGQWLGVGLAEINAPGLWKPQKVIQEEQG